MDVRIRFMGVLADIARTKQHTLAFDEVPTLRALLVQLEEQYGPEFGSRVFRGTSAPRMLQMCTRIFLNKNMVDNGALDEPLPIAPDAAGTPEVLVYFLPAVCGG